MQESSLKEKAISGIFWKIIERIGAQLVSTVVSIVLARILMPEDYGVVGIVAIFFSFCNIFINSGLSSSLVQKKEADELDFSSVLFANLIIASVLYTAVFFCAPLVADIYGMPILIPVMRVMGIGFFIYMLKSVATAHISRNMEFRKMFLVTLVGMILSAVIGIVMALRGFGAWALVAQQLSSAVIDTVLLYVVIRRKFVFKCSFTRLKPLIKYSWKLTASSFAATIFLEIKPLVVGLRYSTNDLAYYTKSENYPKMIATSIDSTLSAVLIPVIKDVQDDMSVVLRYFRRFIGLSSYFIFPVMLGFAAVAEPFVRIVLTDKWLASVPFLIIFCYVYMLEFITLGINQTAKAIGRSDVVLKLEIIKDVSTIAIIALFVVFGQNAVQFAFSTVICAAVSVVIELIVARKLLGYKFRGMVEDLVPNLLASLAMFVIVYLVGLINVSVYLTLLIQVLTGMAAYLIISIITRNRHFTYLLDFVKQRLSKRRKKREDAR